MKPAAVFCNKNCLSNYFKKTETRLAVTLLDVVMRLTETTLQKFYFFISSPCIFIE